MATSSEPAAPSLDVETYIANYTGVTRLKRLAFIAANGPTLKADALRLALDEVKRTINTGMYTELITIADGTPRDDAWAESVDRKATQMLEKLEADLVSHKTSLVKESIRVRISLPCPRRLAPSDNTPTDRH
jgi:COP9 signalosome complex subunit 1